MNQTTLDDEIDLKEIILSFWKEKYLILIITLVFTVAGYIYGTLQPKVYQTTITLRDVPASIFRTFETLIPQPQQISYASNFNQDFKLNLMNLDNLLKFVEQNKKIDEFKSYLKTNNIKTTAYFKGKFQNVTDKKKKSTNQYTLNFSSPLLGTEFLNDYVNFTKQVSVDEFKEQLKEIIKKDIYIYNLNLEIAKSINLEEPHIRSLTKNNLIGTEPSDLFYKGSKVISLKKSHLEALSKDIENNTFYYNHVLEPASDPRLVIKSANYFMTIAFALGLFFSFIIIFVRSMFVR